MILKNWLRLFSNRLRYSSRPKSRLRRKPLAQLELLESRTLLTASPIVTSPDTPINLGATASIIIAGTAEADAFVQIYSDANNNGIIDVGDDAVVSSQQLTGGATEFAIGASLAQEADNNFLVTATVAADESAPTDVSTISVFDQTLPTGGNQSTDIRQAFATTNYAIALYGTYPSRSLEADDSSNLSAGGEPVIGSIMQFAGNFAPAGWALCDGRLLSVSQNDALFSILGTTYGGDGRTTFGLPDLRGRVPVGVGTGPGLNPVTLGQRFGSENVTLGLNNLPSHDHVLTDGGTTGTAGGSAQAFNNRMPGLGLTPVIAVQGLFPSRNASDPSLASISWFAGNFAPRGYLKLEGQLLPINQNQSLYSLLGTTYGGDGVTTFALPDLRGRTPIHAGDGITLGQRGGTETITLTPNTLPGHSHDIRGDSATLTTGGQSINLMMPYLALNFEISLQGLYPSRTQQPENPTDENGDSAFLLGDEYIDRETAYGLIQGLIDEGISRWIEAGITEEQANLLRSATYQIGDLDSGVLASVNGPNLVTIDANASSAGWFVDLTPDDDSEFGAVDETTGELLATDSAALYDYDLLTTIMHEQGHLLGFDHALERGSVMSGILGIGGRLIPDSDDLVLSDGTDTHTELLAGSDFIAQIGMFAGNFAVRGYALTNGQLLPISQNTALFSLIGTTYGGDGQTTMALPDFQGRAIVGAGNGPGLTNYTLGQRGGANQRSLTDSNLPSHTHALSPSFDSITRQTPTDEFTSTDSVTFRITFNQDVQNVDASDFDVTGTTGTISNITQIDARIYDITISGGDLASLNGDVGLDLASDQNIQDLSGLALPGTEPPIDETYTIDNLAPTLTAFARNTPAGSPTSADTLVFDITFNEDVQNVTADDFDIVGTTATGILAGSGASYTLTLSGGDLAGLNGIVGLNLAAAQDITDLAGNALPVGEPVTDETYSVINDSTPPTLTAFARNNPATSPTNADSLVFDITFDEDVQNVTADDFTITGTTATGVLAGSGSTYTLTLSGGDLAGLSGVVGLNLAVGQDIIDLAGNALPAGEPGTDETYTVDNTAPTVTSIVRADSNPTNASSVNFTVTFSEAVTGVGTGDFVIDQTGLTGASVSSISGSGTTYTVTVNRGTGDGTLSIDFDADADGGATDAAGNVSSTDFTAGAAYNVFDPGVLGVALDVSVSQATVTLDYYLENLGTSTLSNVALPNDLDAVFGAGNYTITTAPVFISDPGTIILNGGYDGSSDTDIIGSSTLNAGAFAWIRIVLNVTSLTDQGSGIGVYSNQVTASATDAGGSNLSDLSDSGTDPDPNGNGDPTEVGENDPTPFTVEPGTVGDFVWNDLNGDGVQDGGEAGIAGITVFIDANMNGMLDGGELFDTTDGTGAYQFTGLTEGTYSVRVDSSTVPAGFVLTGGMSPLSVNLGVSQDFNDADFGFQQQDASIGDFVWNDLDSDGIQDAGEAGISGVTVFIDANSNGTLDGGELSDTTDGSGAYDFTGLATGTYVVRIDTTTIPTGFVATTSASATVNLAADEDFNNADFGLAAIETEVTLVGGVLTITDINGANSNDDLTISYVGGTYTITDNGGLVITTAIAGATGNESSTITIPDTEINSIVFDTLGGDDAVTVDSLQASLSGNFTIAGGTGTDTATVNGDIVTTGTGAVDITVSRNIVLNSGSSITTVDGGITLSANAAGTQTADFIGIRATNATIQTTGTGHVQLDGTGSETGGDSSYNYGVLLDLGTIVSSTANGATAGSITITGTAGASGVSNQLGVGISVADVTTVDGDITILGTGGNSSGNFNYGVHIFDSEILSTGTGSDAGAISITGIGAGAANAQPGVVITQPTTALATIDGDLTITGTGFGSNGHGVLLSNDATAQVTNGTLTVDGTASSGDAYGVFLSAALGGRLVSLGSGPIIVNAIGSGAFDDFAAGADSIIGGASASGPITINADSLDLSGTLSVQSTGALTIQPRTANTSIGLGGGAGTLNLTDTELGLLQDGFSSITIGDTVNGTGTIDIDTATFADPVTIAGGTINDNAGTDIDAGSNAVTLLGNVAPGQSPGILSVAGNLSFATASTFEAEIMGATAGTQHDQIDVVGTVNLNNATLNIDDTGFTAIGNESFTLINNDGADAVTGMFNSLAEGATVSVGGKSYTITYVGGDGNDVVLLGDMTAPTLTAFARNTPSVSLTNADTLVFDILFDEDVQNVSADDFTINGTTASGVLTGSGSAYILTISGGDLTNLNGTVSLDLAGSQNITDLSTNPLPAGEPAIDETYQLENIAPTVVVNIVDAALSDLDHTSLVTFEFSEDVVGFDASDLTVVNGTISDFTMVDGNSYTATFTAANNVLGTGSVTVDAGSYTDPAGNLGSGATDNVAIDTYTPDSIIGRTSGGNWWTATTNGVDGFTTEFQTTWDPAAGWTDTLLADVNGDGLDDIVGRNSSGQIHVNLATGTGFAAQQMWGFWSSSVSWQDVQAGDFNGDGKMDLFGRNQGSLWVATSTGTGFITQYWGAFANRDWQDVFVSDFNGDGRDDVVARDTGNWWVALSTGNGFTRQLWGSRNHLLEWNDTNIADVNGDGMMDIVSRTSGNWWVSLSTGSGFTNQRWGYWRADVSWLNVNVADVNGDGMSDLIGRDRGNWWVAVSSGSGFTTQRWGAWDISLPWEDVSVGDFNGDGMEDVAGRRNGSWWVSRSTGTNFVNELWGYWSTTTDWEDVLTGVFN